jgi:hypothetical protein
VKTDKDYRDRFLVASVDGVKCGVIDMEDKWVVEPKFVIITEREIRLLRIERR